MLNKKYDGDLESGANLIKSPEVFGYFLTQDLSSEISQIVRSDGKTGFFGIGAPAKLNDELDEPRDIFMAMAKISLDTSDTIQDRLLKSIYMVLIETSHCARNGQHWVEIGFQRSDPVTDIRAAGILGLYQLLYFIETYTEKARIYLAHSQNPMYEFPFAIKMLEFTSLTLRVLRSGALNKFINQSGSFEDSANELYSACAWHFMTLYMKQQLNIRQMDECSKRTQETAMKSPEKVIAAFRNSFEDQKSQEGQGMGSLESSRSDVPESNQLMPNSRLQKYGNVPATPVPASAKAEQVEQAKGLVFTDINQI